MSRLTVPSCENAPETRSTQRHAAGWETCSTALHLDLLFIGLQAGGDGGGLVGEQHDIIGDRLPAHAVGLVLSGARSPHEFRNRFVLAVDAPQRQPFVF